ncbi:MAG TPA: hypothetical protein VHP63_06385 [candidate division Zixibacteria bacterium]|nr:hypothetical protein [candidate division Zixibacteria bacterium]
MQNGHSENPVLVMTGKKVGQRFEIIVNGRSIPLSGMCFFYLFQLAFEAKTNPPGWLNKEAIQNSGNECRYIYRLKRELALNGVNRTLPIENIRTGSYRLNLSPTEIAFDCDSLRSHPDIRVKEKTIMLFGKSLIQNSMPV